VLRYCERLLSHDTALRGMSALRTHLYEILAASRTDTVAGLRRGDVLGAVPRDPHPAPGKPGKTRTHRRGSPACSSFMDAGGVFRGG